MVILTTILAICCQISMRKLKKKGKPLEKLEVYADSCIQGTYTILWSLTALNTIINFALEIPIEFVYQEGSDILYNTRSAQYLSFGFYCTSVWLMDMLILYTVLRYGRHLDSKFATRASHILSDSWSAQRLSEQIRKEDECRLS